MAKLTIEDLKQIKEKASHTVALRSGEASVTITVHIGECGLKAGARDVLKTILEAKTESERTDIKVLAGECIGLCDNEPNMTIQITDNSNKKDSAKSKVVIYQKMDSVKAKQVFDRHIIGGEVQKEFILEKV